MTKKALDLAIKALEQQPCEDCISRKETIEWLKKVTVTDGITFKTGFEQILYDIEQMPSVKPQTVTDFADKCKECGKILNETYQQKWIPVSERLPKEDGEYFVSIEGNITHKMIVDIAHWYKSEKANNGFYKANEVFAWMPLPQPYKVESEESE